MGREPLPADLKHIPEEELVRRGREAVTGKRYAEARELLFEYCDRLERQGKPISPVVLANYALCLGQAHRVREAIEICRQALQGGVRHPEISLRLAQLYLLAGSRRRAIEEIERGLGLSPHYGELLQLRRELGYRRAPPIPFLSRESALNVRLGRLLRRSKSHARGDGGPAA